MRCSDGSSKFMAMFATMFATSAPAPLPRLSSSPKLVSIGGISSGADLAAGYMTAHSASTIGAAIWAGNAYRCYVTRFAGDALVPCDGLGQMSVAGCKNVDPKQAPCDPSVQSCPPGYGLPVSKCQGCGGPGSGQYISAVNVSVLVEVARRRGQTNLIDPPSSLRGKRVFLYRGGRDLCYNPPSVDHTASFFSSFGAITHFVNSSVASLHSIPTVSTGTPCGVEGNYTEAHPHGLEACNFDGAGEAFKHIYGQLQPPGIYNPSNLISFDQTEFDAPEVGLDKSGWVYVPKECQKKGGGCGVHMFLHGCGMAARGLIVGTSYLRV